MISHVVGVGCLADGEDVSIISEKGEKSRQVDKIRDKSPVHRSQDAEQSQDMPSSELTQKRTLHICST